MFQAIMGWFAVAFHVSGYSYQSSNILKKKKTSSLSWVTFVMNFVGSTLWLLNGILLRKIQPTVTNLVVLTSVAVILYYIVKQNLGWSKLQSLILLISLLALTWGLFIMHICDMYVSPFLGAEPSLILQAVIAIISALFTMVSFIPQLIKMFITKDTKHVSYVLSGCYGISNILWLIFYITMFNDKPIIVVIPIVIASVVSAITQGLILSTKFFNEKKYIKK